MKRKVKRRRRWIWIGRIVVVLFIAFAAVEIDILPFPWEVAKLKTVNPGMTSLMKERMKQAKAKHEWYIIHEAYIPLSMISKSLVHAVIVGEDGTFYRNDGVDWHEVKQSLKADIEAMKIVRGSSTISMQLAKNLWFTTSRDPLTKFNEVISAYMLNFYLSKYRIMELYLNYIEFGRGIFGVQAASEYYFNKPASELTRLEAAKLEAIVPDPLHFSPNSDSKFVTLRTADILRGMKARGW